MPGVIFPAALAASQAAVFERSSWGEQVLPTQLAFPASVLLMAVILHQE